MLELLAPAGSMDALRAAVQSGANAVYLGSGPFNARQNAKNFSLDELPEAVRYCHVRGVQVHLTLNTLVTDRELEQAAQTITAAARAGVDAFIVQDLGLVSLLRQMAPEVPIHASTQMSIHSVTSTATRRSAPSWPGPSSPGCASTRTRCAGSRPWWSSTTIPSTRRRAAPSGRSGN